jgi:hypothetical protein
MPIPRECAVDYICYLSRPKVDQLHEQIESSVYSDMKERLTTELSRAGHLGAFNSALQVLGPLNAGITYGRKDTIQFERKLKVAYVDKLREVLLAIYSDHGDIPDITSIDLEHPPETIYYYYEGDFRCSPLTRINPSSIAQLVSKQDGLSIELDCSLRYFSESSSGTVVHSGNRMFFDGTVIVRLAGVFLLLGIESSRILGSPLYLKLVAPKDRILRDIL